MTRLAYRGAAALLLALLAGCSGALLDTGLGQWIYETQRLLHRELAAAMRAVAAAGAAAGWTLVGLSALYGVFHAAGPGHGKAVIATYLATHETRLRRGIELAVLSSLAQGLVAILVVEIGAGLLDLSMRQTQAASRQVETAGFALVAVLGLVLSLRSGGRLLRAWRRLRAPAPPSLFAGGGRWQTVCTDCGSLHSPQAAHLEQPTGWRSTLTIVATIGLRPCTGAILVLLLAHLADMRWAGIAAVMAMSAGTAATVALLATLAVHARRFALRWLSPGSRPAGRFVPLAPPLIGLAGGLVILWLGLSLLATAWRTPPHPLF